MLNINERKDEMCMTPPADKRSSNISEREFDRFVNNNNCDISEIKDMIRTIDTKLDKVQTDVNNIKIEQAGVNTKTKVMWGAVVAAVSAACSAIVAFISRNI
jgi:hypothetical protein